MIEIEERGKRKRIEKEERERGKRKRKEKEEIVREKRKQLFIKRFGPPDPTHQHLGQLTQIRLVYLLELP